MPDKDIFVLKIFWKKSIASLHRLTQAMQRANLRLTAGDPTWVIKWLLTSELYSVDFISDCKSYKDYRENVGRC